jgi:hypothetical protein
MLFNIKLSPLTDKYYFSTENYEIEAKNKKEAFKIINKDSRVKHLLDNEFAEVSITKKSLSFGDILLKKYGSEIKFRDLLFSVN